MYVYKPIHMLFLCIVGFPDSSMVKSLPAMQETWVQSLSWEDPLEKEMVIHSNILIWETPRTEKPGRLKSMGSQKSWTRLSEFTTKERIIYSGERIVSSIGGFGKIRQPHAKE